MPIRGRSAAEIAAVREHHGVAILQQAALVAIGGLVWKVYRNTAGGDGVGERAGSSGGPPHHLLQEAYVWGAEAEKSAPTATGTKVGDVQWTLVGPTGLDLLPEDVIESNENSRIKFTVKVIPPMAEHTQAELEPRIR